MKILVVGGGGREHAICWKLSNEKDVEKIYCAPGNPGIAKVAECVNIGDSDIAELVKFAKEKEIDITVVGPEVPLVMGLTDVFEAEGLKVFGPNKKCAQLEGSKAFSKDFMIRHGLPTAKYKEYTDLDKAIADIDDFGYPVVIKADGLAAGKGVVIPENREDAIKTLKEMMSDKKFGDAGEKIVIEEFLNGIETSILAFVDHETIVPMVSAKDHKKVYNFEKGPNTGGMGTFSPSEIYTDELSKEISEKVLNRTLQGFKKDNLNYKGVLFIGLMITEDGPKVLEYNVRFGDPETQSVLSLMESDLVELIEAALEQRLNEVKVKWMDGSCVNVVLASGGYPGSFEKGFEITIDESIKDKVFLAGAQLQDEILRTSGGRVLSVVGLGTTVEEARKDAYEKAELVNFQGKYYRKDIGIAK